MSIIDKILCSTSCSSSSSNNNNKSNSNGSSKTKSLSTITTTNGSAKNSKTTFNDHNNNNNGNNNNQLQLQKQQYQHRQKQPKPMRFMSIKFLYKNPIGRQFTKEHLPRDKDGDCDIWRARDDPHLDRDPQLQKYILSIPDAVRFRGLLLQGYLVYAKVLRQIEQFHIRHTDVWLVTYPKSGTTWTEEILSLIQADGDVSVSNSKLLVKRVPHLEVGAPLGHIKWLKNIPAPRLLATHLPIEYIPAQLRNQTTKAKVSVKSLNFLFDLEILRDKIKDIDIHEY